MFKTLHIMKHWVIKLSIFLVNKVVACFFSDKASKSHGVLVINCSNANKNDHSPFLVWNRTKIQSVPAGNSKLQNLFPSISQCSQHFRLQWDQNMEKTGYQWKIYQLPSGAFGLILYAFNDPQILIGTFVVSVECISSHHWWI